MRAVLIQYLFRELVDIVDASDCRDGVRAMMRTDDQRLGLVIRDTADSHVALHFLKIALEFRPERTALYIVNCTVKSVFSVDCHARPACSEM